MPLQYHCIVPLLPDAQETNKNKVIAQLGIGLPIGVPRGQFLFCFRRTSQANTVNMVWFKTKAEGQAWLQRSRAYDYVTGTTEEFLIELADRKPRPSHGAAQTYQDRYPTWLEDATASKTVIGSILMLVLAFFSWNYAEFFGPDSVYYFARKVEHWPDFIQAFTAIDDRGHYRPMGMLLFSYVFSPLFKFSATGYHVVPLLFHVANTVLVYRIALRILRSRPAALGTAGFFALHRINFFVTYSITFIPDFTGMFFLLAAFLCYLKRDEDFRWSFISLLLWICALCSKEVAVVFPAILTSYELLASRKRGQQKLFRFTLQRTLAFWLLGVGFLAVIFSLHGNSLYPDAIDHPYHATWSVKALIAKAKYLWWGLNLPQGSRVTRLLRSNLGIQPTPIRLAYPFHTSLAAFLLMPFMVIFVSFVVRNLRRNKMVLFGALYFLLALCPVLPLSGRVMQHNLYFALFGLALLFGIFARSVLESRYQTLLLPLIIVFLFSTGTGVVNQRHSSWPVIASRTSAQLLAQFHSTAQTGLNCSSVLLVEKTGRPDDVIWHTDGGNLFRVFGPCPRLRVLFEDLNQKPPAGPILRLNLKSSVWVEADDSET